MTVEGRALQDLIDVGAEEFYDQPMAVEDCPACKGAGTTVEPDGMGACQIRPCSHCKGEGIVIRYAS